MTQRLTALWVTSDEFFQNSFFEHKIAISTLHFVELQEILWGNDVFLKEKL